MMNIFELTLPQSLERGMSLNRSLSEPTKRAWEKTLPQQIQILSKLWQLENIGEPFQGGFSCLVLPAQQKLSNSDSDSDSNDQVVIKLSADQKLLAREAKALLAWNSSGAPVVKLLEAHPGALLLERIVPGEPIRDLGITDLAELIYLLHDRYLTSGGSGDWVNEHPAKKIAYVEYLADGRKDAQQLVESAKRIAEKIKTPESNQLALCHGDLYDRNILISEQGIKVIDPHGITAPAELEAGRVAIEFHPFSISESGAAEAVVDLSSSLGLNPDQSLLFAKSHALIDGLFHWRANSEYCNRSQALIRFAVS
jgi:streptomycin 6-kinase